MKECIFCQIAKGKTPCHKIWEDKNFLAFLSIHPNTDGASVVIPKKHFKSDVFEMPDNDLKEFIVAIKKVAKLLDRSFEAVGRTALVFEGYGVDHAHAKLFPLHGTNMKNWVPILSGPEVNKYFKKYEGYVSSHSAERADDKELEKMAKKINRVGKNSINLK